jgi:hypothetical protein
MIVSFQIILQRNRVSMSTLDFGKDLGEKPGFWNISPLDFGKDLGKKPGFWNIQRVGQETRFRELGEQILVGLVS